MDLPANLPAPQLQRRLSLPLIVFYGLGVTIGAGIYVLIGATAGIAGKPAPFAFLLAAVVVIFPAASYAELTSRLPYAAGEARYVEEGFGLRWLVIATGLVVALVGIVSAAAIAHGATGYLSRLVDADPRLLLAGIILAMGFVAAWGVRESVSFAALFTLIEVGGLLAIIIGATLTDPSLWLRFGEIVPAAGGLSMWNALLPAALLAFFAFIGFEDMVNMAEEARNPLRDMPIAIAATLVGSTLLYFLVASVAVLTVPVDALAASTSPLSLVFERATGAPPLVITAIALIATVNGIVIQIIMAARVFYGMAGRGHLPALFARVSATTHTPVIGTAAATGLVLLLALAFPITRLAEWTSQATLVIFALVCLALVRIKRAGTPPPANAFTVPMAVPVTGTILCLALLVWGG